MSTAFYVVLPGPPPALTTVGPLLAHLGVPRGSWATRVKLGPVELEVVRDASITRRANATKASNKKLVTAIQIWSSNMFQFDSVAKLLMELAGGGVLLSEEGVVLLAHKETRRGKPRKPEALPAIDVTIPGEVRAAFTPGQPRYALAMRTDTPYALSAFIDAVAHSPKHRDAPSFDLTLEIFGAKGFPLEKKRHRVQHPHGLYRLRFRAWYVKSAKPAEWDAMLAVISGLGHATQGVLYTISAEQSTEPPAVDARYDFAASRRPAIKRTLTAKPRPATKPRPAAKRRPAARRRRATPRA